MPPPDESRIAILELPAVVTERFVSALENAAVGAAPLLVRHRERTSQIEDFHSAKPYIGRLRAALRRLEQRESPFLAMVEGDLCGFGFELALACHARFFSDPAIRACFPIIHCGNIPALGTTQRLPWLVGADKAVQVLLFEEALLAADIGELLRGAASRSNPIHVVEQWVRRNPKPQQPWDTSTRPAFHSQEPSVQRLLQKSYLRIREKFPPEDEVFSSLLRCFHDGWERSFDAGLKIEAEEVQRLAKSPAARNRERICSLRQQASKGGTAAEAAVRRLGILGSGLMGTGIALTAARAGCDVRLFDVSAEALDRTKKKILKQTDGPVLLERITFLEKIDGIADADFVIEAVFERLAIKKAILETVSTLLGPSSVLASNTTTLPISSLAEACRDPTRFIGTHFFSPVERMELLEIIVGSATSEETLDRALGLARSLRKVPIVARDGPGFYTSRVVMAYAQEAFFLVREGVSPILIDSVARNAGMPIGPLAMADVLSLDLHLDIARSLAAHGRGAAKYASRTVEILSAFVQRNRLGRKTGGGIYDYPKDNRPMVWPGLASLFPQHPETAEPEIIAQRLFVIQTLETLSALKEGIIREPDTADLASVLGWVYPAFKGGPVGYIDYLGGDQFERIRANLENQFGERFAAP